MFQLLYFVIQAIQPFLVPICFVCAWAVVIMAGWSLYSAAADGMSRAKRMHTIPCANCVFFTNDYRLKCPVRPTSALTEEAIGCSDYRPAMHMRYGIEIDEQG